MQQIILNCVGFAIGLGFRDLKPFNLTLLARHCCQLLNNTQSLLYCVLKQKYFPNVSFVIKLLHVVLAEDAQFYGSKTNWLKEISIHVNTCVVAPQLCQMYKFVSINKRYLFYKKKTKQKKKKKTSVIDFIQCLAFYTHLYIGSV